MNLKLRKFQDGGAAAPQDNGEAQESAQTPQQDQGAPQEQGGGQDPIMQIAQAAAQALQGQDCQAALAVCQAFLQLIQQQQGGAPEEQAPEGEPVYRAGGKLVRRIKK